MISKEQILNAIQKLGLVNTEVCIHSSMRSFGDEIEGGLQGIVESFIEKGNTILVPTFTYMFAEAPAENQMIMRNGIGNDEDTENKLYSEKKVFSRFCKDISASYMGRLPEYILNRPDSIRGNHPINSFTALGQQASKLIDCQNAKDVYAPFKQLYDDDGYVLLMGVDLDSATIIHYAEQLTGRTLFVQWARNENNEKKPVAVGSCSEGFNKLYPILKDYEKRISVGSSIWSCYRVRDIVDLCTAKIKEEPQITHCDDVNCARCNDAVAGGPIIDSNFWDDIK